MTISTAFSVLTLEPGLARYLKEIARMPMLEPREEYILAKRWCEQIEKKLFFNLHKLKAVVAALPDGNVLLDQVVLTAGRLGAPKDYVVDMNRPLGGDATLNTRIPDGHDACEWQEWRPDDALSQEQLTIESESFTNRRAALRESLSVLDGQERRIFEARRLADEPSSLDELAHEFGVSRERARQIEVRAFEKVQNAVRHRGATAKRPELYNALA
jgi:RNA polymerase sigma-32 factor